MGAWESGKLPRDLQDARSRFQSWRQRRQRGDRIPDSLWMLAVRLVRSHGVSRTALTLGLDFYRLKRRAEEAARHPRPSGPAFVEVVPPFVAGKQCLFELHNRAGASLRVQLTGYDAAEVDVLVRGLWGAA